MALQNLLWNKQLKSKRASNAVKITLCSKKFRITFFKNFIRLPQGVRTLCSKFYKSLIYPFFILFWFVLLIYKWCSTVCNDILPVRLLTVWEYTRNFQLLNWRQPVGGSSGWTTLCIRSCTLTTRSCRRVFDCRNGFQCEFRAASGSAPRRHVHSYVFRTVTALQTTQMLIGVMISVYVLFLKLNGAVSSCGSCF